MNLGAPTSVWNDARSTHLPRTLGVPVQRLLEEVDEYFEAGARVRPGDTVFDVGAFALRAAQHAQGDHQLYCFEPSPFSFQALTENSRENALLASGRPQLLRLALGAPQQSGRECTFYHFANFPTDSTLDIEAKREEFEQFFCAQGAHLARRIRERRPYPAGKAIGERVGAFVDNPLVYAAR